jgi:hypothetical protein
MLIMLSNLGGIGAGLAWGWLVILVLGRGAPRRLLAGCLGVATATMLFCLQYLCEADWAAAACFLVATSFGMVLHLAWFRSRRRL